jgi:hypothetical protein
MLFNDQIKILGVKMTAINSLTHIRSIHTNVEPSSKHIRTKYVDFVSKKMFFHHTANDNIQLQIFVLI